MRYHYHPLIAASVHHNARPDTICLRDSARYAPAGHSFTARQTYVILNYPK